MENYNEIASLRIQQGRKEREDLNLPILYYVVADDWINKLGERAFCGWLKLHSWVDRSDKRKNKEDEVIPTSLNKLAEKFSVHKKTLYDGIIAPLWNYGLIDLIEYPLANGKTALNIVVYEFPKNDSKLQKKPLEKVRDYHQEWKTKEQAIGKKGGKKSAAIRGGSKIEPLKNTDFDGSKIEPPMVQKLNHHGSKIEPNNYTKQITIQNKNNYTNNNIEKPSPKVEEPTTQEEQKDVVVDVLKSYGFEVNKTTLKNWRASESQDHRIIQAIQEAINKPGVKNLVGYVGKMLDNGYTPAVSTPQSAKTDLPEYIENQIKGVHSTEQTLSFESMKEGLDYLLKLEEITPEEYDFRLQELLSLNQ